MGAVRWLLLIIVFVGGCRSGGRAAEKGGTVGHVVIFWLKTPGDSAARQKIIDACKTFEEIPGIVSIQAGPAVPSTRPIVDSTYDVGVIITFENEKAMRDYDQHPIHRQAVNGVLKDLVERIRVYDIANRYSAVLE